MTLIKQDLLLPMPLVRRVFVHAVAWIIFVFYEVATVYFYTGAFGKLRDYVFYYAMNIGFFYLQALYILPKASRRTGFRYLSCGLFMTGGIMAYLLVKFLLDHILAGFVLLVGHPIQLIRFVSLTVWRGLYFMGFGTVYWLIRRTLVYRRQVADAGFAFLQQQISPHFLFNTLSFVYNSVYPYSEAASNCILELSDLMRYSFRQQDGTGKTGLAEEIDHIRKLIAINRLRFDHELFLDFATSGIGGELRMIPLVLLTLAENIFKHGNLNERAHPATMTITADAAGELNFVSWNLKKRPDTPEGRVSSGLQNTLKRLDHSYRGKYRLQINDQPESYQLTLWIQL